MAIRAGHPFVRALQGELGLFLVIENGRLPCHQVVAGGTVGRLSVPIELAAMDVLMASVTGGGSAFERDQRWALADHWLMAFQTSD